MKRRKWEIELRSELGEKSESELRLMLHDLREKRDRLRGQVGRSELLAAVARRRVLKTSGDVLLGTRLESRLERLFEAVRQRRDPWPVDEVVRVIDGLVARLITRRISLSVVGLMTVIPAVASLILLAKQNSDMIEKNIAEETADFKDDRAEMTDILFARWNQVVGEGAEARMEEMPAFHPRLRAEAFNTLVALEKQRWTEDERQSLPPSRFVDLRGNDLSYLVLGGAIGLEVGAVKNDFTRLRLDGADLTSTNLLFSFLDHSVFQGAKAEEITVSSPSMNYVDFRDVQAAGARFEYNGKTGDFLSMTETRFDRSDLSGALFFMAYLERASLDETNLTGAVLNQSHFFECDFTTAVIGESTDWSDSFFHKCLVTEAQAEVITLPAFCFLEPGEEEGTRRIMTDPEKYQAFYEQHDAEMREASLKELEEMGYSPEEAAAILEQELE